MSITTLIISALMQGMIYAPLALGVFIAFNILKISDLTLDGSFVFGMAVCAVLTISGHPVLALILGTLSGAAAGFITGILQTKLKINQLLSGILTMTALYTVNFAVLGGQA
ncbi:MAG: ABC transporter permease, partial [Clostridia bacterium]|nr:ABC transporter permease [Clostridia bacterium]